MGSATDPAPLLLAATSARALAQSAVRGGYAPHVLDRFGDQDTRAIARGFARWPEGAGAGELARIGRALEPGAALIYGAGFEGSAEALRAVAGGRRLHGNGPEVLERLSEPRALFELFARLRIPHPEVSFRAPGHPSGWLCKDAGGSGGMGVGPARVQSRAPAGRYWQRRLSGPVHSLLFLADGERLQVVGWNRLYTCRADPAHPYAYGGACGRAAPPAHLRGAALRHARHLIRALGLVGLNGIDFIVADARVRLLELNPRPGASFALYDADWPGGLLRAHVSACGGRLPGAGRTPAGPARVQRVVYAAAETLIPRDFRWPDWCADLPRPGSAVAAGEPVCSVLAQAPAAGAARQQGARRVAQLRRLLAHAGCRRAA
ncbi:MAG: ATP-grasp domain-containing protein [Gammaproteobacteria bacterium]|nr:ATP-grasp domain-containing protein [Gammaproteobacteria bacterium]